MYGFLPQQITTQGADLASPQVVYQSFRQALARWPADPLRPECQLQDVIGKRLDKEIAAVSSGTAVGAKLSEGTQLKQVNALYSLLENRYQTKVRPLLPDFAKRESCAAC